MEYWRLGQRVGWHFTRPEVLMPCCTFLTRHSIHSKEMEKAAIERFPEPVEGAPGVFYTGYHSERSFGGAAWLITDSEAGNVLVDSPRFDPKLVSRIKVRPCCQYLLVSATCCFPPAYCSLQGDARMPISPAYVSARY